MFKKDFRRADYKDQRLTVKCQEERNQKTEIIDKHYEKLRRDLADKCMAACFGGGIGPALLDSLDIEKASNNELERIAGRYVSDLNKYKNSPPFTESKSHFLP